MANPEEAIMSDKQPLPTGTQLSALDPTFRERPHEYLDRLRAEEPVHRDTELGRLFLTRFEDVRLVLSNRGSADWCHRRSTSARWTPFAPAFAPLPMAFSMH